MTAWHRGPMLAFDLETTGPHPDTARIVTATVIVIEPGCEPGVSEWLIAPDIPIPAGATAIHGVTNEHAHASGMYPEPGIYEITARLGLALGRGIPIVGMNLAYDMTVLDRECRRHQIDTLDRRLENGPRPLVDIFVLDKQVDTYRKGKRTLTAMAETYGIPLTDAHNAASDALASVRIAWRMAEKYPELQLDLDELHALQVRWRRAQSASLQAYFDRQGKHETVNGDWPVQQLPIDWTPQLLDPLESSDVA